MIRYSTTLRVRYSEVDQMQYLYHPHYLSYMEIARTEMLRESGYVYAELEKSGIIMPVRDVRIKYMHPAHYDDLVRIEVFMKKMPTSRLEVEYEFYNQANELMSTSYVCLAFVDAQHNRLVRCPEVLTRALQPFFDE